MKTRSRSFLFSLVSIAVVLAYLATAVSVRAEDETPPAPTEEPAQPPGDESTATDEPVATIEPVATEEPAQPPTADHVTTQEPAVQEETSVEEILSQVPEGTDVVVVDENGNPLSMTSQEAAAAILTDPDPVWCPDSVLPGGAGCTSYFNRFTTGSGLIDTLQGGSYSGPGTIYVSTGDIAVADQNKNIVLNGNSMLALSSDNLTIQGGWDFGSNSVSNRSVFVNSTFEIRNWTGNITVNDLKFELAGGIPGDGLTIKNIDGNVTLNNIVITDSQNDNGLFINNVNDIEINDSRFNDNNENGAELYADGTIDLNNVIARDNDENGVDAHADGDITIVDGTYQRNSKRGVRAQSDNGAIDVTGSEFINNQMSGIRAEAYNGDITLSGIYSARNDIHGANLGAAGDIYIEGASGFINNEASGVHIMGLIGSLFVSGSSLFSENDGHGLDAEFIFGDAEIDNSIFEDNKRNGLNLNSVEGDINITLSHFLDNNRNGAYLDNSCGCVMGNIFISSSTFDFNGSSAEGRGLIAHSLGDITLANVSASGNGGGGAELINCFLDLFGSNTCLNTNAAKITLTGTNAFNDNGFNPPTIFGGPYGSVGLWAESNGDVALEGVTAEGNGFGNLGGGAFIFTENGNLSITNSNFSENCTIYCDFLGFGFIGIDQGGDVTLNGVTANGNGDPTNGSVGFGSFIFNGSGNLFVENSNFSGNCAAPGSTCAGGGIGVLASGSVYFDQVTANSNGTTSGSGSGASIEAGNNVDIYCSTFSNNAGFGLTANIPGGSTISLNGVTFGGNGIADFDFSGGTLVENPFDCNPSGGGGGGGGRLPAVIIPVTGGEKITCDAAAANVTVNLPDGNFVILPCPVNEYALVDSTPQEGLPGPLEGDLHFISALTALVIRENQSIELLDDPMTVSFLIPDEVDASKLAILFWDGAKWIEVEGAHVSEDGHFEGPTNFVGTFVLVQK